MIAFPSFSFADNLIAPCSLYLMALSDKLTIKRIN